MKRRLLALLKTKGGFTYSVSNETLIESADAYAIAVQGCERQFTNLPTVRGLNDFIHAHAELFQNTSLCIGGWKFGDSYYLDVVELFDKSKVSRSQAISIGKQRNQLAIFDLSKLEEVTC